jgi:hypothetical protein
VKDAAFPFRFVEVRGVQYLRLDDVATFLRELGGTEETDVRNRIEEAARRITDWRGRELPASAYVKLAKGLRRRRA